MTGMLHFKKLDERRKRLGMSYAVLATRSGVSMPTVVRILSGRNPDASFAKVMALADALGISFHMKEDLDEDELREKQARRKAEYLVRMVQGTSSLEGQAVDSGTLQRMVRQTTHELLGSRSNRKLWGE